MAKCDFCDKDAVHFCSHARAQACELHIEEADKVEFEMLSILCTTEEET